MRPMTIKEIRDIERYLGSDNHTLTPYVFGLMRTLLAEVHRLRQGLYDCAGISGADLDGNTTPDSLVYPDIVDYAKREVQQLRDDYDEALAECTVH